MDAYSKLDHETLVRNMNAVCAGLGRAVNQSGFLCGVPPTLTFDDLDDLIPLTLYRIAVAAGWIEEQTELTEDEYYHNEDADLFGGCLWLTASYKEWFFGLVADTLTTLEAAAEKTQAAQEEHQNMRSDQYCAWLQSQHPKGFGKQRIDEYRKKVKPWFRSVEALAKAATEKSKAAGDNIAVTRISVSRIYNGRGKVGPAIRQAVANLINEQVPCTEEDLLPPSRRSTPRNTGDSTKK